MRFKRRMLGLALFFASVHVSASLYSRDINKDSIIDAYYDDALNITWLANVKEVSGTIFDSRIRGDGLVYAGQAKLWADQLDVYGVSGWRLPKVAPVNGTSFVIGGCSGDFVGACDYGTAITRTSSELSYMLYVTLGNSSIFSPSRVVIPGSSEFIKNTGPFLNLVNDGVIWYETTIALTNGVGATWSVIGALGNQTPESGSTEGLAWAVHDGDIFSVPEPSAVGLLTAGLASLALIRRKKAH